MVLGRKSNNGWQHLGEEDSVFMSDLRGTPSPATPLSSSQGPCGSGKRHGPLSPFLQRVMLVVLTVMLAIVLAMSVYVGVTFNRSGSKDSSEGGSANKEGTATSSIRSSLMPSASGFIGSTGSTGSIESTRGGQSSSSPHPSPPSSNDLPSIVVSSPTASPAIPTAASSSHESSVQVGASVTASASASAPVSASASAPAVSNASPLPPFAANYSVECKAHPSVPQDRRANKSKLRVVSFNAEWLFLGRQAPAPRDFYPPTQARRSERGSIQDSPDAPRRIQRRGAIPCPGDCTWTTDQAAADHFETILSVIQTVDADIINLVEIENCTILQRIADYLPHLNYRPYLIKGTDTATGQNVGILTRVDPSMDMTRDESRVSYPVAGTQCGTSTSSGTTTISKHYLTAFNVNGRKVGMVGLHLLSQPTNVDNCKKREAQALVGRGAIARYLSDVDDLIILGDLNDYDNEVRDFSDSVPTSRTLLTLKTPDSGNGLQLTNVAARIPQSERYSSWWDKDNSCSDEGGAEHTMIDHILVSPSLYSSISSAYIFHGWTACCLCTSDHWPVVVEFDV